MAEKKNTLFDRPGGYAMPTGATARQREAAADLANAGAANQIRLLGDQMDPHQPASLGTITPAYTLADPQTEVFVGDCRDILPALPEWANGKVDLIFADPPFNWDVPYDEWADGMPWVDYERFTYDWLDACISALAPTGSLWVNIPDDTAAEIVLHLKRRGLTMINWCVWHFRFGQHRTGSFIMSKVHALYFVMEPLERTWNPEGVLEPSDRAAVYGDARTQAKDEHKGLRVPMDVWYGKNWGRVQGNNKERRPQHHNQIPEVYLERVIRSCSNEGDIVLDPFLGSGTTCTIARELKRRSIGIEYGSANAKSAFERIQQGAVRVKYDEPTRESSTIFPERVTQPRRRRGTSDSKSS
ncbi:MAG: site-specific DNA-methyltransferase [Planctomycetes bacterium]|nr:site-specific DNA-methyltransferase [Planctomycetota bacterium]NOG55279.1 site-specific DNA-methyltransferase [Planctomycetota bacterium]